LPRHHVCAGVDVAVRTRPISLEGWGALALWPFFARQRALSSFRVLSCSVSVSIWGFVGWLGFGFLVSAGAVPLATNSHSWTWQHVFPLVLCALTPGVGVAHYFLYFFFISVDYLHLSEGGIFSPMTPAPLAPVWQLASHLRGAPFRQGGFFFPPDNPDRCPSQMSGVHGSTPCFAGWPGALRPVWLGGPSMFAGLGR
jgi:hypothetical protein